MWNLYKAFSAICLAFKCSIEHQVRWLHSASQNWVEPPIGSSDCAGNCMSSLLFDTHRDYKNRCYWDIFRLPVQRSNLLPWSKNSRSFRYRLKQQFPLRWLTPRAFHTELSAPLRCIRGSCFFKKWTLSWKTLSHSKTAASIAELSKSKNSRYSPVRRNTETPISWWNALGKTALIPSVQWSLIRGVNTFREIS